MTGPPVRDIENQKQDYEKPVPDQLFDQSFKVEKPRFNDWPFALFFWAVVAGFIAVAGITLNALKKTYGLQGSSIYNSTNDFTLNTNTVILFGFVVVVGVVLSALVIVFARMAPRFFIGVGDVYFLFCYALLLGGNSVFGVHIVSGILLLES